MLTFRPAQLLSFQPSSTVVIRNLRSIASDARQAKHRMRYFAERYGLSSKDLMVDLAPADVPTGGDDVIDLLEIAETSLEASDADE